MPILPENLGLYPSNWVELRAERMRRSGERCEQHVDGRSCGAQHGKPHPVTGSRVVLSLAHLNHDPSDNRECNLMLMCQRCHNRHDQNHRAETRRGRSRARAWNGRRKTSEFISR